jgi:exodeoxyribonuclease V alpha subunit
MTTATQGTPLPSDGRGGGTTVQVPTGVPAELAAYVSAGVITADDVAAAAMLGGMARRDDPSLAPCRWAWLAMCLAIRAPRDGHTCVHLADAWSTDGPGQAAGVGAAPGERTGLEWPPSAAAWLAALRSAGRLVGLPDGRAPFVLDGQRLYLGRSLHEERAIAERLVGATAANVEILLGGPGTGKTTQVATRLIALFRDNPDGQIALAAPTGKAAARMAEALRSRLHDEHAPPEVRDAPQAARDAIAKVRPLTIHKLLGYRPHGTPRYTVCGTNRLAAGLVIVDEASMISSSLMHRLLDALGDDTHLLLVGDPDQLASVDAGTVLGDIATAAARPASRLHSRTTRLTIRHRFGPRIGALADAILAGGDAGVARAFEILENRWTPLPDPRNTKPDDPKAIRWIQPGSDAFQGVVDEVVEHAARVRDLVKEGRVPEALAARKALQVLCAHRAGSAGVAGWNARVEGRLGIAHGSPWYSGRPLMVTRNNPALDLFNGDVGLVVADQADGLRHLALPQAASQAGEQSETEPRRVSVARLEEVETVHALTIHKSQGSEYGHAIVALPERASRIVTRELLYTGVTRASETVTIIGSRAVIEAAIRTPIRRATGLADRLESD